METHYVYKIVDTSDKILHIGKTINPNRRFKQHTGQRGYGNSTAGLFYHREDVRMIIVREFNNKPDSTKFEGEYKLENGFEWTEKQQHLDLGKKAVESGHLKRVRTGPNGINNQKVMCPDGHITNHAWKNKYCAKHGLDALQCIRIN